jgi:hypothetical protein
MGTGGSPHDGADDVVEDGNRCHKRSKVDVE